MSIGADYERIIRVPPEVVQQNGVKEAVAGSGGKPPMRSNGQKKGLGGMLAAQPFLWGGCFLFPVDPGRSRAR